MMEPYLIPVAIVFIVIGIPTICVTAIVLAKMGGRKHRRKEASLEVEETKVMQEIHQGLTKLEKRIEALETIIIDKK